MHFEEMVAAPPEETDEEIAQNTNTIVEGNLETIKGDLEYETEDETN